MLSFPSTEEKCFFVTGDFKTQYLLIGSALLQQNSLQIDYELLALWKSIYSGSVLENCQNKVLSHRIKMWFIKILVFLVHLPLDSYIAADG